jgi:two-component system capsular synthesis response regulator RcsB
MMFERVLIAEDQESTSISVRKTIEELKIADSDYVFYCDDAFARIRKALKTGQPYDLLITDLSFEEDHNVQKIIDGAALIKAAKDEQPGLKVLVFSAEGNPTVIDALIKDLGINGYVRKARHDAKELRLAIEAIAKGNRYFPAQMKVPIKERNTYDFTSYDTTIIALLANGVKQKEIPEYLQDQDIKPSGLSSIEKRLNLIRDVLGFSTNEQLIAYCKDFKII